MADQRGEQESSAETEQTAQPAAEQSECMPCRGSGRVISNLGGEEHVVDCPWCEGSGRRVEGIDAQAHWQGVKVAAGD